jgi:hypothetical protein
VKVEEPAAQTKHLHTSRNRCAKLEEVNPESECSEEVYSTALPPTQHPSKHNPELSHSVGSRWSSASGKSRLAKFDLPSRREKDVDHTRLRLSGKKDNRREQKKERYREDGSVLAPRTNKVRKAST